MSFLEPSDYPRRILLIVSGMSPQILTETLYALTQNRNPPFMPTEVHMLTTTSGAENARLNLLSDRGHFYRFCAEYGLDSDVFTEKNIYCIRDTENRALDDIRSISDNEAAADYITAHIRSLTADDKSALHVSMAGGRKTMGYYAGYALSLYGREQDRLSHVLVSDGFENHRDFYYPTRDSYPVVREGKPDLDARDAEVTLAEIPFVRMRQEIPRKLLEGQAGFNETILMAQRALLPQRLLIDLDQWRFSIADTDLASMGGKNLAFFIWLLKRQFIDDLPPIIGRDLIDYNKTLGNDFCELCRALQETDDRRRNHGYLAIFPGLVRVIDSVQPYGLDRANYDSRRSDLNKSLETLLGPRLSEVFKLHNQGSRGKARYAFSIDAEQLDWVDTGFDRS